MRPPTTAVDATAELVDDGLYVTLDFLGEDTLDLAQAEATVAAYKDAAGRARPPRPRRARPRSA